MIKQLSKKIISIGLVASFSFLATPVKAADIVVVNPVGQQAGAHEIWVHSEMGQSFVAEAANVIGGFWVEYSPEAAALTPPNAPVTQINVNLYEGEGIDAAKKLYSQAFMVDTNTKGFLDVNFANAGIQLVVGNTYTLGISSPDNRGWMIPSVCDFINLDASGQPSGAYLLGHPFFNGQITVEESGICDNAFHMLDTMAAAPTPTPVIVTPTPTPVATPTPTPVATPTPVVTNTGKKVELKGIISSVDYSSIVVKGTTVYITPSTVIKLNYQPSLEVGQKVQVKGRMNIDGTVTALKIEVR